MTFVDVDVGLRYRHDRPINDIDMSTLSQSTLHYIQGLINRIGLTSLKVSVQLACIIFKQIKNALKFSSVGGAGGNSQLVKDRETAPGLRPCKHCRLVYIAIFYNGTKFSITFVYLQLFYWCRE